MGRRNGPRKRLEQTSACLAILTSLTDDLHTPETRPALDRVRTPTCTQVISKFRLVCLLQRGDEVTGSRVLSREGSPQIFTSPDIRAFAEKYKHARTGTGVPRRCRYQSRRMSDKRLLSP